MQEADSSSEDDDVDEDADEGSLEAQNQSHEDEVDDYQKLDQLANTKHQTGAEFGISMWKQWEVRSFELSDDHELTQEQIVELGEQLLNRITPQEPIFGYKITGMLLKLPVKEVCYSPCDTLKT